MFESLNDILNIEEVMQVLDIGKNKVYQLLNKGEIKGFRLGKKWKVPKKMIEEYVMNMCKSLK